MKDQSTTVIFLLIALSCVSFATANPCYGLWWGEKVQHPDCRYYYACYLTVPTRRRCGSGKVFDNESRLCQPGNQDTCEVYGQAPATTTTTTTTTTTPPPPSLDEICYNVFFGARPYPNSYELFVGCIRSRGVLFQCLDDEVFDSSINECVHKVAPQ